MEELMIISIILMTLGVLPLIFVLIKRKRQRAFMAKAISTTAEVRHCEKRHGTKGTVYYILSLHYKTVDGKQLQRACIVSAKQEKGERIPLLYLPEKPEKFSIDFGRKTPVAIALSSLFFVLIAGVCIWLNHL